MRAEIRPVTARPGREGVHASLGHEGDVWSDPGLVGVQMFETVLFFVFPFHVFLFVKDRVPPDVEETVGPGAATDHEGAEVKAGAVLGDEHVDGGFFAVAVGGVGDRVEVEERWGVGDV